MGGGRSLGHPWKSHFPGNFHPYQHGARCTGRWSLPSCHVCTTAAWNCVEFKRLSLHTVSCHELFHMEANCHRSQSHTDKPLQTQMLFEISS